MINHKKVYTSQAQIMQALDSAELHVDYSDSGHLDFLNYKDELAFSIRFVPTFTAYVDIVAAYQAGIEEGKRRKTASVRDALNRFEAIDALEVLDA